MCKQQEWRVTYYCSTFGARPPRRKCAIGKIDYWQPPLLRMEAIMKFSLWLGTVNCSFGTDGNCHPCDHYLKSRERANARSCNRPSPPSVRMDNGCSLSHQRSFRLERTPLILLTISAKSRLGTGRCRIEPMKLRVRLWSSDGSEVPVRSTLSGLPNQTGLCLSM